MSVKTPEEYLDSLRDGRVVYCRGERIEDVTAHPWTKPCIDIVKIDYIMAQKPEFRDLVLAKNAKGEPVSFNFLAPRSKEDLLHRREIVQAIGREFNGVGGGKLTGVDGLNGVTVASERIDRAKGTKYAERVQGYRSYLQEIDAALALAMTDPKGDRSKHPSKQAHPDYYLRIVGENSDGIVVRGAKMHVSFAPGAHEMLVLPCRAMGPDDKDYAVSFGLAMNHKGVTMIAQGPEIDEASYFNHPPGDNFWAGESVVVFEDVLVPHDRVFLKGEWDMSAEQTYMFANYHRVTADAYKYQMLVQEVGIAALLAEYNGIERYQHVRDKLSWLVMFCEATEALGRAACESCVREPGTDYVYPDPMLSNIAKLWFADSAHQAAKHISDIGGGIMGTMLDHKDFAHPVTGPLLERYLGGKAGIPTEHRMLAINAARDMCRESTEVAAIHAEGSLAAQRMSIYALADWERYKKYARQVAGIP